MYSKDDFRKTLDALLEQRNDLLDACESATKVLGSYSGAFNDPTKTEFGLQSDYRDPNYLDMTVGVAVMFQHNMSAYLNYRRFAFIENYSQSSISTGFRAEF